MLTQLVLGLHHLGYEISPAQLEMFNTLRTELERWNQRVNLTAITEPDEVELRHFLDSLSVLQVLATYSPTGAGLRMIDVGAGAGFPGIPLKLVLPGAHLTLLEATGKKVEFLRHMVTTLNLVDSEVVHGRAEDVAHLTGCRERFDLAVARGVAHLATLAEICLPFVKIGGLFVAPKKGDLQAEIDQARFAVTRLGGDETRLVEVTLPQLRDQRYLVCSTKIAPSPARYPRRSGMPFKHPL
jgi:16S rRNA (guanine527-N7)-methyltransferase